ncbi:hypothetical protein [Psychromicrobium lacuslunae]|uniref:Uncharacterized protein n=1 Tax=Psychromicrobium lacuslunae TaxID=1618207 RepID=A0A0D4BZI8_9MICC|nr:hypothetical protein [Psychromicrobium lacuslunae]AJT41743.1 hypothetical protein UM93_09860 [Psychromicrobium lacuslunae]
MNKFEVIDAEAPAILQIFEDWSDSVLWTSGKYGFRNPRGEELSLSPELIEKLVAIADENFSRYDLEYPPDSLPNAPDFQQRLWNLAREVRDQVDPEWVVTCTDPEDEKIKFVRPTWDSRPALIWESDIEI